MSFKKIFCLAKLLPVLAVIVNAYQWPSPQYDALEEMLYEGESVAGDLVSVLATGCISRVSDAGPPIAAEWLRLAYHDMATHNATAGTGGLDASIYYEYDRPENVGAGNLNSLNDFGAVPNKYVSRADVIAMGAIWGVAGCGGPPIAFRGGRVDALAAGRFGVPQPQEDLQTHIAEFKLQGSSPTEMISLVACGHTIGGVRNLDFPNVVPSPDPSGNATLVDSFDTTIQVYDSNVVSEYLKGTTQNPLVVGPDATFQSDRRIFSSDGNATMKSMNSPGAFSQTCSTLLARMLNTVPSNVRLTEEITFLPFKVRRAQITIEDSQLVFHVAVRVQFPPHVAQNVTLFWCDRRGAAANCADGQANFATGAPFSSFSNFLSPLSTALGITTTTFTFDVPLGSGSVQKFWFEVGNTSGGPVVVEDNGGAGYIIEQDTLIALLPTFIGLSFSEDGFPVGFLTGIAAGVLGNSTQTALTVTVQIDDYSVPTQTQIPSVPPPRTTTQVLSRNTSMPAVAGYSFYSAIVNFTSSQTTLDYTVEVNGQHYAVDFVSGAADFAQDITLSPVGKTALQHHN